ncbi:MAG: SCP2 sterol-binding domain-containing protein [Gammaproteobacteria bacterium SHHR-1]|uniref:ubiquinone anaerobic biosynthesis accessory factor UbiT n=1 Tax=Magnetovirga frankeli TaxID=947516 RepID=UPI001292E1DD|nr:SCP2 sterol-binding domain-containing protein [gamma proteobacterium SS-5]
MFRSHSLHPSADQPLDQPPRQIRLPRPLSLPLRLMPGGLHSRLLARMLNHTLAQQLADAELDMMQGRTLQVSIQDAGIDYRLTLEDGRMQISHNPPDVILSGHLHDFLLLLTRREDPDTLFFQRRLSIQGDTGLGLSIKNFLDSLDWDELPLPGFAQQGLDKTLDLYQRVFR